MWWNKKVIFEENVSLSQEYRDLQDAFRRTKANLDTMTRIADSKARRIAVLEYQIANPSSEVKALDAEQRRQKQFRLPFRNGNV